MSRENRILKKKNLIKKETEVTKETWSLGMRTSLSSTLICQEALLLFPSIDKNLKVNEGDWQQFIAI